MSRLPKLMDADIPAEAKPLFDFAENMMGFTPNDAYDMARNPAIASTAAGCKYCQVHTAHGAHTEGEEDARILAAWDYETSDLFNEAERAALRVAQAGAMTPSLVTDAQFVDMRAHYSDAQIVEIVAVISMFGFLNRWNAIMDTELETTPLSYTDNVGITS